MEHLEQPTEPSGSDGPATELEPSHEEANGPHEPTTEDSATPLEPSDPLTPTGRVILGMIAFGKQTGYDIKQIVDRSVRHFWAASYGQIYPELRRLEEQGLITGHDEPSGGRARTVYKLTEAGERALQTWLTGPSSVEWEVRDEGM